MPWTGRPPRLTPQQHAELREVARLRKALPSNAELARRYGVTRETICGYLSGTRAPKRYRA